MKYIIKLNAKNKSVPLQHLLYLDNEKVSLERLQGYVKGYIEAVDLGGGIIMIVNEEGKLSNLPVNHIATALAADVLRWDDFIFGDVVLLRGRGENFDTLTYEDVKKLKKKIQNAMPGESNA